MKIKEAYAVLEVLSWRIAASHDLCLQQDIPKGVVGCSPNKNRTWSFLVKFADERLDLRNKPPPYQPVETYFN